MNKLKVALQDLRDYLGKDAEGLKRLKEVEIIANDQRRRCATLEAENTEVKAAADRGHLALVAKELELDQRHADLAREINRRTAAEAREQIALARLAASQEPDEEPVIGNYVETVRRLFRRVRRRFKTMPRKQGKHHIIYVDQFVKAFHSHELRDLGSVVALCACMGLSMQIDYAEPELPEDQPARPTDELLNDFSNWFTRGLQQSETGKRIMACTRFTNYFSSNARLKKGGTDEQAEGGNTNPAGLPEG